MNPRRLFAIKLQELVKLAYSTVEAHAQGLIAKDAYVKGLHTDMQLQLKSLEKFAGADIQLLVEETLRLEIASIKSASSIQTKSHVNVIEYRPNEQSASGSNFLDKTFVDAISNEVFKKLEESSIKYIKRDFKSPASSNETKYSKKIASPILVMPYENAVIVKAHRTWYVNALHVFARHAVNVDMILGPKAAQSTYD